jgi:hypothetical protein
VQGVILNRRLPRHALRNRAVEQFMADLPITTAICSGQEDRGFEFERDSRPLLHAAVTVATTSPAFLSAMFPQSSFANRTAQQDFGDVVPLVQTANTFDALIHDASNRFQEVWDKHLAFLQKAHSWAFQQAWNYVREQEPDFFGAYQRWLATRDERAQLGLTS